MKEPTKPTAELLRRLPLFAALPGSTLERISKRMSVRQIPARGMVFRHGEPSEGLFLVVRGRIRVYRANRSGREQILHEQLPGQALAEVPLFDGGPYPASARAEEDSELLFLPADAFRELYRSEPEIADAVIRELGRRLRRAVRTIEKISLRDVTSRVGLTLLDLAEAAGQGDRRSAFTLPMTQGKLAETLATTRESVARGLRALEGEGLIEREGARLRIPDPEALEERGWRV